MKAMLTEEDRNSIAHANFVEGRLIGKDEGYKKGVEDGEARGKAEGKAEGRMEMMRMLLASGMSMEELRQRLQLSDEEVEAIRS